MREKTPLFETGFMLYGPGDEQGREGVVHTTPLNSLGLFSGNFREVALRKAIIQLRLAFPNTPIKSHLGAGARLQILATTECNEVTFMETSFTFRPGNGHRLTHGDVGASTLCSIEFHDGAKALCETAPYIRSRIRAFVQLQQRYPTAMVFDHKYMGYPVQPDEVVLHHTHTP